MDGAADLIITDTALYIGGQVRPDPGAVAVHGGRILAIGAPDELRDLAGPKTDVRSLPGRLVVAGFQDAHVHPGFGGQNLLRVNLDHVGTVDAYLETIAAYAAANPDEQWITGGGWAMYLFPGGAPRKEALDRIVADRPVFLMNRDVHGAWVNSLALEIAGITKDTPDPWDGRIERDTATGEPTGTLHEGAAYSFRDRFVPPTDHAEWRRALLVAQQHLHALGITAWQDAWVTPDILRAYGALDDAGELTMRVSASLWWDRHRGEEQIAELVERGRAATKGNVRAMTVKIMTDGVVENCSCALLEPYGDPGAYPPGHRGLSYVGGEDLRSAVVAIDAQGFQVHMHAIGDRATRDALDAIEGARSANGPSDNRHHVAHLQVVHPDDVPRFGSLGVIANMQPLWACMDPQMGELTLPRLGEQRVGWQYPFGDLARAGATLAGGSDWPVSTPNPLLEMEVAVTRVDPGEREAEPFLPDQRLTLTQAFDAFTMGSATVNHDEEEAGSIEVGKRADLAVLDRDVFAPDAAPLGDARVVLTIAAGRVVHEAS
ncbi:MAG: amidohydrolase [Actinomycetota bacterium]